MKLIIERILRVVISEVKDIYPLETLASIYSQLNKRLRLLAKLYKVGTNRIWSDTIYLGEGQFIRLVFWYKRPVFNLRVSYHMEDKTKRSRLVIISGKSVMRRYL